MWAMRAAARQARRRRILVIPGDVDLECDHCGGAQIYRSDATRDLVDKDAVDASAALLNGNQSASLCSAGCRTLCQSACRRRVALAEHLKAPIVQLKLRGKEYMEYDNPFDVGMTGLIGFASGLQKDEELRRPPRSRR